MGLWPCGVNQPLTLVSCVGLRNLTGTGLTVVFAEPLEPLDSNKGGFGILRNWTSSPTWRSHIRPAVTTACLVGWQLNVHLGPFTTNESCLDACPSSIPNLGCYALRFTILADAQKYRLTITPNSKNSQKLHCVDAAPQHELIAITIYNGDMYHVAICDATRPHSWMKNLADKTPLSALSIPGSHNSPTCYRALPSVRCQAVGLREQLDNGVRFLDVRVQPDKRPGHDLILVHSFFSVSLTGPKYFHSLVTEIYEFLRHNASETVMLSVKREGTGSATDADLARILHDDYTNAPDSSSYWYTSSMIPSLGAVRGKIVLLRRFRASNTPFAEKSGINAEAWADNTPHNLGEFICIQDFYKVMKTGAIGLKIQYAELQMERAAACVASSSEVGAANLSPSSSQPLYLNFLSGSNLWRLGCWPERIARKVNPWILKYLVLRHAVVDAEDTEKSDAADMVLTQSLEARDKVPRVGDGSTGIVVCDMVGEGGDWDLVKCIIAMNSRLVVREMHTS